MSRSSSVLKSGGICFAVVVAVLAGAANSPQARGLFQSSPERAAPAPGQPTLADAQSHFYNARYEAAATLALRAPLGGGR